MNKNTKRQQRQISREAKGRTYSESKEKNLSMTVLKNPGDSRTIFQPLNPSKPCYRRPWNQK